MHSLPIVVECFILYFFSKTNTSIEAFNTLNVCHERGKGEVDIGFREVTISYVTLSCSPYLLYYAEC